MNELTEGSVTIHGFFTDEDYDDEGLRLFSFTSVKGQVCGGNLCVRKEWIDPV